MTRANPPWTQQGRFLRVFAKTGNAAAAARAAGIDRRTAYRWRHRDSDFARRWKAAEIRAAELLRDEAMERALMGRERIIYRYRPTAAHRAIRRALLAPGAQPAPAAAPSLDERLRRAEARVASYMAERAAEFPNTDFEGEGREMRGGSVADLLDRSRH